MEGAGVAEINDVSKLSIFKNQLAEKIQKIACS
jgi:hypothetical protein